MYTVHVYSLSQTCSVTRTLFEHMYIVQCMYFYVFLYYCSYASLHTISVIMLKKISKFWPPPPPLFRFASVRFTILYSICIVNVHSTVEKIWGKSQLGINPRINKAALVNEWQNDFECQIESIRLYNFSTVYANNAHYARFFDVCVCLLSSKYTFCTSTFKYLLVLFFTFECQQNVL